MRTLGDCNENEEPREVVNGEFIPNTFFAPGWNVTY